MTTDPTDLSAPRFLAVFLACAAIVALPIFTVAHLPLTDYPNHLARMHILASAGTDPALQRYYDIVWQPVPNLAMDLIVPALAQILPLEWAGKAFFLIAFLMTVAGVALLHRALFRRWSAWPLLAFLLLYNRSLLWGFGNFVFGVGLGMMATAWWVRSAARTPVQLLIASVLATALYFSHFFAFGAYALIVFGIELQRWRSTDASLIAGIKRLVLMSLPLLPAAAAFVAAPHSGGGAILYSRIVRKLDLLFTIVDNYVTALDIATLLLLVGLVVLGAVKRRLALERLMVPALIILVLAQIAMPNRALGAAGVDHRMPVILALLFVAASDVRGLTRRQSTILAALLGALFIVRIAVVEAVWLDQDRALAPMIEALEQLPRGSRLAVAYPPSALNGARRAPPVVHLAAFAAIGADAFVPTLFAEPGQQPLRLTAEAEAIAADASPGELWDALVEKRPDAEGHIGAALARFDFVIFEGKGGDAAEGDARLTLRAAIADARLYTIAKGLAQ